MTPTTAAIFGEFPSRLPDALNDGSFMAQIRNEAEVAVLEGDRETARLNYRVVLNLLDEASPVTRAMTSGVSAVYSAPLDDMHPKFVAHFAESLKALPPRQAGIVLDLVQQTADFFPNETRLAEFRDFLAQKQEEAALAQKSRAAPEPPRSSHPIRDAFARILRFQF